jgi:hypothetical protein
VPLDPKYLTQPKRGPRCSVGLALETLQDERHDLLQALLTTPGVVWTKAQEHSEEDLGVFLKAESLSRHARGRCTCD